MAMENTPIQDVENSLPVEDEQPENPYGLTDADLLQIAKDFHKESFDNRWVWERQWMRNIHYVNMRQWLVYDQRSNQWKDKRMAKHIPRPVTSKPKEGVQAIRAIFTSVKLGATVRPNGTDPKNVAVANTADEFAPVLHEEHEMESNLNEFDYWFIVTGNAFLHEFLEYDYKYGSTTVRTLHCEACGEEYPEDEIAEAGQVCPHCGAPGPFSEAVDEETGEPVVTTRPLSRGATVVLSPFELAFPNFYARFEDSPGVIRLRWRSKQYAENHPDLKSQMVNYSYSTQPGDRTLAIFKSLPNYNDMGLAPIQQSNSFGGSTAEEGYAEYEYWFRPSEKYPKGLVFRVAGQGNSARILHLEKTEGLPGVLPNTDIEGNPLFPFQHAAYEQVGGRIYGSGPIDAVITKIDDLNQLDSMIKMIIQRMANPLWMIPKGSEIEKFTGAPGLVVKWNPLTVGGNAKPERIPGEGPHGSFFSIREMILKDIEDSMGTYDIIKGAKPTGVEAFSALQLLVERSQSRMAGAFQARGLAYKGWLKIALEIERQFGPQQRIVSVMLPSRAWTLQTFMNANLQGSFSIVIEDGSTTPKTNLGTRAAIEHLKQLGVINPADPDQAYQILTQFGQTKLIPSMDVHVQAALQKQEAFEQWAGDPMKVQQHAMQMQQQFVMFQQKAAMAQPDPATGAPVGIGEPPSFTKGTPLDWKPWYKPEIHMQEFMKWANSDRMRMLLQQNPGLEVYLTAHLDQMKQALIEAAMLQMGGNAQVNVGIQKGGPNGGGTAMAGSNRESGNPADVPSGNGQGAQNAGPR